MHLCAERFFKVKVPPPPALDELLDFYESNWISSGYESAEEETKYREYGRDILIKFWEIHSASFHMPLAIEKLFYIDIDGIKLRGFIDRVDKLESGGLSIIDYKTSRELFTAQDLESDLQLTLYQMAAERMWQLPVERLTLYHMRSNTPCICSPREESQLEKAKQLVLDVAENIVQEIFPAAESDTCPCDFPEHCPYYRHLYMETDAKTARQELLPGIAMADAVENYAHLQEEIKELQSQLDEAKQAIINFCNAEGINRIAGNEHDVTYKLVEKTGFNEEQVRAVLGQAGLWERVTGLDQARLKQLLTDKEISRDIKDQLKELRQVISAYPQLWVKNRGEEEK